MHNIIIIDKKAERIIYIYLSWFIDFFLKNCWWISRNRNYIALHGNLQLKTIERDCLIYTIINIFKRDIIPFIRFARPSPTISKI